MQGAVICDFDRGAFWIQKKELAQQLCQGRAGVEVLIPIPRSSDWRVQTLCPDPCRDVRQKSLIVWWREGSLTPRSNQSVDPDDVINVSAVWGMQ